MSHVVKVDTIFKSLECLKDSVEPLGLELLDKQKYNWWGHSVGDYPIPQGWSCPRKPVKGTRLLGTCDYVLRQKDNPGGYEVGVYKKDDDTWGIIYDFYGGGQGLMDKISTDGRKPDKLIAEYEISVAQAVAVKQGWTTRRENGGLTIEIYDPETNTIGTVRVGKGGVDAANFTGGACLNPVTLISEAMGVPTSFEPKPEYYEDPRQRLRHS